MTYNYKFPDATQYSGQHAGFFESQDPGSRFSSGSRESAKGSYRALEEELSRTVAKLAAIERDLDIQKCV